MTRNRKRSQQKPKDRKLLWIGAIILVSALLFVFKNISNRPTENVNAIKAGAPTLAPVQVNEEAVVEESLEKRFNRLTLAKEPVFAFYHSNNCQLCLQMIEIVKEVYPEYEDKISLVDINVYDDLNKNLLIWANIHSIPTQIFINDSGEISQTIGLMTAGQLREALDKAAEKEK